MPVDEILDLDLDANTTDLDKLDRQAAKAIRTLEKQRKALDKAQRQQETGGGIFQGAAVPAGERSPADLARLSKQDKAFEKTIARIQKRIQKDEVKQFGNKQSFLKEVFGDKVASNIFNFGKNPTSFITNVARTIPWLGGVFAAKEIAEFIIDELARIDRFFKAFVDRIDDRINVFRDRQDQAEIAAGRQQVIFTTSSGSAEPRDSYNSFNEFNSNRVVLEDEFSIRNTTGVD